MTWCDIAWFIMMILHLRKHFHFLHDFWYYTGVTQIYILLWMFSANSILRRFERTPLWFWFVLVKKLPFVFKGTRSKFFVVWRICVCEIWMLVIEKCSTCWFPECIINLFPILQTKSWFKKFTSDEKKIYMLWYLLILVIIFQKVSLKKKNYSNNFFINIALNIDFPK